MMDKTWEKAMDVIHKIDMVLEVSILVVTPGGLEGGVGTVSCDSSQE